MLGFLKPRGELVEISGRTVVFLSAKPYKMDQRFEVRLGLPDPPGQTITVAIRVLSCRPGPETFFVVVGIAEGRREPPNLKGYPLRNYARSRHRVTVKSEGLPSYRAVTRDLGRGGFGAELDGELPEGKLLLVNLEFDEPLGWTLDLKARVAWSQWKGQNRYDTGFAFVEEPAYALALEQLGAWCDHMAKHEIVPFKPPDRLPPRPLKELPNQLPQTHQTPPAAATGHPPFGSPSGPNYSSGSFPAVGGAPPDPYTLQEAQRAALGFSGMDDDPTPLGLPTLVQPPPRPTSLKLPDLPQTIALERPSAFPIQPAPTTPAAKASTSAPPGKQEAASEASAAVASSPSEEDVGVRIHFEASLRGWAWEGADDTVSVVLEDVHGTDHWLEFPGCRGLAGRCRQREIRLLGMAVAQNSTMIDELVRHEGESPLLHFRFYDDHQRVVLDVVAPECREQAR